jgi:hypothetical protein
LTAPWSIDAASGEDECVRARILPDHEAGDRTTLARWEHGDELRTSRAHDVAVVPGVGDQQHEPVDRGVSALESDAAQQCLDIVDSRLGLDVDHQAGAVCGDRIERSLVAGDRERHLEPPGPRRPETVHEPLQEAALRSVEARVPARIRADGKVKTDAPGVPNKELGGDTGFETQLDTAQPRA